MGANSWYYAAVEFAYERGLLVGVSGDRFAPQLPLTRNMAVAVLHRLLGQPGSSAAVPFTDVAQGSYYDSALRWAYSQGVVTGRGAGSFDPEQSISRQELAVMLYRGGKSAGLSTAGGGSLTGFNDTDSVALWAREAVGWAVDSGLIHGRTNGDLDPAAPLTRAEMAVILNRFCQAFPDILQGD